MGADEYRFDPGRIVVKARGKGARLGIVLHNRGDPRAQHPRARRRAGDRGDSQLQAGRDASGELNLPPGSYDFVCTVADHEELGMVGKIEVR